MPVVCFDLRDARLLHLPRLLIIDCGGGLVEEDRFGDHALGGTHTLLELGDLLPAELLIEDRIPVASQFTEHFLF